jgi:hypothetical protein
MSAKYKSPSFLLPNEINTNTNPLNTDGNPATGTGINSLYSMDFNGTDYISAPNTFLNSASVCTLSFWMKGTGEVGGGAPWNGLQIKVGANATDFRTMNGSNVNNYISFSPGTDWHHYVGVYVGGSFSKIYIDGVLRQTLSTGIPATLASTSGDIFKIGYGQAYSVAKIDEVALWNRALSDGDVADGATATGEIAALYGGTSPNIYPSNLMAADLGPIAYYPLGEQAQNTGYLDPNNPGSDMSGSEWQFPNGVLQDYVMDFGSSVGKFISLPNEISLSGEFAMSFWLKPTANNINLLGNFNNTNYVYINPSNQVGISSSDIAQTFSSTVISSTSGNWQNLLITRDSSNVFRTYVNGDIKNTVTDSGTFSFNQIGRYSNVSTNDYRGEMSNVVIWNTDQSANIANIYNNGSPQTTYTVTPQNWWKLNADSVYTPSVASYSTALDFDSLNSDYISIPNSSSLTNGFSELTVSIWANFSTLGTQQIISKDGATSQRSWILRKLSSGVNFLVSTDGTSASQTLFYPNANITVGRWYHFVGIYDGSKLLFYVDGVLIDDSVSLTGSLPSTTSEVFIGTYDYGNSNTFDGKLSNAAIYNTALTSSQVSTLFNFGTPETNISFSPQAWWKLNDQTAITDSSNNGNTGTNNGATNAPGGVAVTPSWKIPSALTIPTVNYTAALDFDKTQNDNVFIGSPSAIQNLTNITLSVWVKVPYSYDSYYTVASKGEYGASGSQWYLTVKTGNSGPGGSFVIYKTSNSTSATSVNYTTNIDDNKWHNIVCINDGTDLKVYIDGQLDATNAGNGGNIYNGNRDLKIGRLTASSIGKFDGLMSNMVIWGDSQETEVPNIYNNGTPATSYTNTPVAWWKLDTGGSTITDYGSGGNNGTNNGAAKVESNVYVGNVPVNGVSTTLPSTALQQSDLQFDSPYSNYSLNFDGITSVSMDFTNTSTKGSISVWVKPIDYTTGQQVIWCYNGSGNKDYIGLFQLTSGVLGFETADNGTNKWRVATTSAAVSNNTWTHLLCTFDGSNAVIYVNGVAVPQSYTITSDTTYWWDDLIPTNQRLGILNVPGYGTGQLYNGSMDENTVWNTNLTEAQVLEIYNNGRPKDLSTFSGTAPISWWRLGENAYFQDTTLVLPNSITGAPNGEAATNNVEMISADAPGTYANGIGTNLAILDRVGDAPLSTSNSQSYNMIPSDISPYVPKYVGNQIANNFSMTFSGVLDYISLGNPNILQITGAISLSFWFNSTASTFGFITKSDNGSYFSSNASKVYEIGVLSNTLYWQIGDGTNVSNIPCAFSSYLDGNWHHVVATWDGSTNASSQMLFVDGLQVGSHQATISAIQNKSNNVIISSQSASYDYVGKLDEVAIFDKALTPDQVKFDLYKPTAEGTNQTADIANNPNLPTPVAWYRMGD